MKRATTNVKIDVHRLQQLWDIEQAAGALIAEYERHGRCVVAMSMDTEVSTDLLDALARAVRS